MSRKSSKNAGNKGADQDTSFETIPDEMLTESEKRHEKYRRQQAMAGRFTPAAEAPAHYDG